MKKGLLTIGAILALSLSINAQVDTLSEFFTGTPTVYGVTAGGTVSGNNAYGDLQKMQLFDPTHGVAASGTITGVALWVPIKVDAGGSFDVAIWADNNGTPGTTTLATKTITIASVDTTTAGYGLAGTTGFFNVVANFSTPVAIPSNHKFWAGVILPTTAGDTIALVTNTDGDFADTTNSGELWSDNTFHQMGDAANWGLKIAFGVYPIVSYTAGINENMTEVANVFPNPANDVLNINLKENMTTVNILSTDGKLISSNEVNANTTTVNVSDLTSGMYMYQITTSTGAVITNTFVKK